MFKINKVWKLVCAVFWMPGILILCLGEYLDIFKMAHFGFIWAFATFPFWGSIIFLEWVYRKY